MGYRHIKGRAHASVHGLWLLCRAGKLRAAYA